MSCELTPKVVTKTYPAQAPEVQACDYLQEWKACECCPNGFAGYDKTDGPYTYCLNGTLMIAEPLTTEKNCDDPQRGSQKASPTWRLFSLSQWMGSKQDRLVGSDGNELDVGTCVPTCAELNAVSSVANTARAATLTLDEEKQDQLLASNGNNLPGGTCVPTCAELDIVDTKAENAQNAAENAQTAADLKQGQLQNCAGNNHAAGGTVPSCDEMNAAIAAAIGGVGGGDGVISGITFTNGGDTMVVARTVGADLSIDVAALNNANVATGGGGGIADCAAVLDCVEAAPAFTGEFTENTPMWVGDAAGNITQTTAGVLGLPAAGAIGGTNDAPICVESPAAASLQLDPGHYFVRMKSSEGAAGGFGSDWTHYIQIFLNGATNIELRHETPGALEIKEASTSTGNGTVTWNSNETWDEICFTKMN